MMKQALMSGVTAAAMLAASGMALAEAPWRHAGTMGMRQFVVVQPAAAADAAVLKRAAREVCLPGQACVVVFWREGAAVPKKMPMTRAQQRAVIAQYFRNPASGNEELLLKCRAGEPSGRKCLR
jgi:hypothetical protein